MVGFEIETVMLYSIHKMLLVARPNQLNNRAQRVEHEGRDLQEVHVRLVLQDRLVPHLGHHLAMTHSFISRHSNCLFVPQKQHRTTFIQ